MNWILVMVISSTYIGTPGGTRVELQSVTGFKSHAAWVMGQFGRWRGGRTPRDR